MATTIRFTPGKWRVVDRTTNGVKGYEICWSDNGECVTDHVYEEADAHVMAAAKDLYEALYRAMKFIESHVADPDITEEMSKAWMALEVADPYGALAKARGES